MSSSAEVHAVSEAKPLPKPAALPTKAELPVPTDVPNVAPFTGSGDAVSIDVSGTVTQQSAKERQVADTKGQSAQEADSLETASKLVENLTKALDQIKGTKVSFAIAREAGANKLRFQVIDTDSGEVVREFPPEIAESLSHRTELAAGKGLLVEDAA